MICIASILYPWFTKWQTVDRVWLCIAFHWAGEDLMICTIVQECCRFQPLKKIQQIISLPCCVFRLEWLWIALWGDFNSHPRAPAFSLKAFYNCRQFQINPPCLPQPCKSLVWQRFDQTLVNHSNISKEERRVEWAKHRKTQSLKGEKKQFKGNGNFLPLFLLSLSLLVGSSSSESSARVNHWLTQSTCPNIGTYTARWFGAFVKRLKQVIRWLFCKNLSLLVGSSSESSARVNHRLTHPCPSGLRWYNTGKTSVAPRQIQNTNTHLPTVRTRGTSLDNIRCNISVTRGFSENPLSCALFVWGAPSPREAAQTFQRQKNS